MRQQKVTTRSKLNGKQCPLCRRVLRIDECALVSGDAGMGYVYHRDCVEKMLEDTPWDGEPSQAVQYEQKFEELQQELTKRYASGP